MNDLVLLKRKIEIKSWLDKMKIKNYKINDDLKVDVYGDVNISGKYLNYIPVQFGKVSGNFFCNNNNLTTLKGCPIYLQYDLSCRNNNLITLEYAPKKPYDYGQNPCTVIYDGLDWEVAHKRCAEYFQL